MTSAQHNAKASLEPKRAKHTPGPWAVERFPFSIGVYTEMPENQCLAILQNEERLVTPELEANARLIAAAPDLLEACKSAIRMWDEDPRMPNGGIADSLRAAITKAEGQS